MSDKDDYDIELPQVGDKRFILWQDPENENETCGGYFEYTESGEWVKI